MLIRNMRKEHERKMAEIKMEPGKRYEGTDRTGRTAQMFLRDNSGEPAYYMGPATDREALVKAFGCTVAGVMDGMLDAGEDDEELSMEIWWMTAEEVAEIPDI